MTASMTCRRKVIHATKEAAIVAAMRYSSTLPKVRAYRCKVCRQWHVGRDWKNGWRR